MTLVHTRFAPFGVAGAAQAADGGRLTDNWMPMVETCTGYAETGQRAVFDDWQVIRTDEAGCTVVARSAQHRFLRKQGAAVTDQGISVAVGGANLVGTTPGSFDPDQDMVIGDAPKHFTCVHDREITIPFETVRGATVDWLEAGRSAGRLTELSPGPGTGAAQGCGFDRRPYVLVSSEIPGMSPMLSVVYPAPPETRGLDPEFCEPGS